MNIKLTIYLVDDNIVKRGDLIKISDETHSISYLVKRVYRNNWWYKLKIKLGIKVKPVPRAIVKILSPYEVLIQLKKAKAKMYNYGEIERRN